MGSELLERARDLCSTIMANAAAADESSDVLPQTTVDACFEAGLFDAAVPRDAGGAELTISDCLDLFAEISYADGSTGWCVMAGATAACFFGAYCPDSFLDEMFAGGTVLVVAGQFAPNGTAVPNGRGFHLTGSYSFGSGVAHADWVGPPARGPSDGKHSGCDQHQHCAGDHRCENPAQEGKPRSESNIQARRGDGQAGEKGRTPRRQGEHGDRDEKGCGTHGHQVAGAEPPESARLKGGQTPCDHQGGEDRPRKVPVVLTTRTGGDSHDQHHGRQQQCHALETDTQIHRGRARLVGLVADCFLGVR